MQQHLETYIMWVLCLHKEGRRVYQPGFDFYLDLTNSAWDRSLPNKYSFPRSIFTTVHNISSFLTDFPLITFLLVGSSGNTMADPLMDQEPICTDFTLTFFALVVFVFDVIELDSWERKATVYSLLYFDSSVASAVQIWLVVFVFPSLIWMIFLALFTPKLPTLLLLLEEEDGPIVMLSVFLNFGPR